MTADVPGPEPLHGWRLRDYDDLIATLGRSRETQRISQHEIARRTSISQGCVSEWFSGKATPTARHLCELADALGYDLALVPRDAEPDAALIRELAERAQVSASSAKLAVEIHSGVGRVGVAPPEGAQTSTGDDA